MHGWCAVADSDGTTENWDEIHGFVLPGEFQRFTSCMTEALEEGVLEEVDVGSPYSGSPMFAERWFRSPSGQVWGLIAAVPPTRGSPLHTPKDHRGRGWGVRANGISMDLLPLSVSWVGDEIGEANEDL